MNLSQLQTKVRRCLWGASNRRRTVLQRAQFFNKYIVPKFIHLANVFPLPKKKVNDMQKACSKFIWRNHLGRIALGQSHPKLTEEGLGLVILEHKCRALYSATLIKQFPRGIQCNKLFELLDRKSFEKSKAEFHGTPGT